LVLVIIERNLFLRARRSSMSATQQQQTQPFHQSVTKDLDQAPDEAIQNQAHDEVQNQVLDEAVQNQAHDEVQNQTHVVSKKRKTPEPSKIEDLLARKNKFLSIMTKTKAEIEANKARNEVLKVKQVKIGNKLTSINQEIALVQIDDRFVNKNLRLDGQFAKRQKREDLEQEYANRVNVHDPKTCDQLQKSGLKCQKPVGHEGGIIDGQNWCKSCLQKHALAELTSKFR